MEEISTVSTSRARRRYAPPQMYTSLQRGLDVVGSWAVYVFSARTQRSA